MAQVTSTEGGAFVPRLPTRMRARETLAFTLCRVLMRYKPDRFRTELYKPTDSTVGRSVEAAMNQRQGFLEKCAVNKLQIMPNDRVLEVGFGSGVGLKCAYWRVKEGDGIVHGVDFADGAVAKAKKRLSSEIDEKKIQIHHSPIKQLPFESDYFDKSQKGILMDRKVFLGHHEENCSEILRVMKPGSTMVTTIYQDGLDELMRFGILTPGQCDPITYMVAMENAGFQNIQSRFFPHRAKLVYQCIFAQKPAFDGRKYLTDAGSKIGIPQPASTLGADKLLRGGTQGYERKVASIKLKSSFVKDESTENRSSTHSSPQQANSAAATHSSASASDESNSSTPSTKPSAEVEKSCSNRHSSNSDSETNKS